MIDIDNHESLGFRLILGETYQLVVDDEGYYTLPKSWGLKPCPSTKWRTVLICSQN